MLDNTSARENIQEMTMSSVELDKKSMKRAYDVSYTHPKQGDISEWRATYTISPINADTKYSRAYYDCTGFVASGKSVETGKRVSFLSHQDTFKVYHELVEDFRSAISWQIENMLEEVIPESFDIWLFWGFAGDDEASKLYGRFLQDMCSTVRRVSGRALWVVSWPNIPSEDFISSDFLYNNNKNTLQTYRTKQRTKVANGFPFRASEFFDIF